MPPVDAAAWYNIWVVRRHDRPPQMLRHRQTYIEVEISDLDALKRAVDSGELDPEQERVARILLRSLVDDED